MIEPMAISNFVHRQKLLLRKTYDAAWATGVGSYQPDPNPAQEPDVPRDAAEAGLSGAALLAVRRTYNYVAPTSPDPVRRAVALAPSFGSLNRMTGELATLAPSTEQLVAVGAVAPAEAAGAVGVTDLAGNALTGLTAAHDAFARALADWVSSNGSRLDGGASVAWAGEQNGFGEAADADGQLLTWQAEEDDSTCSDCSSLASMPPQPLSDWPCQPGDGATQCSVGCRCSLDATDMSILPNDTYAPQLSDAQQATMSGLMDAQQQALASQMSDAQYLD
jgi:hypothetical protein